MDDASPKIRRPWRTLGHILARLALALAKLLLGLLVLLALIWLVADVKYGHEVHAAVARLHAQGEPVTLAEVVPRPVPDADNAAVLYQQVFHLNFEHYEEPSPNPRRYAGFTWEELDLLQAYLEAPTASGDAQVAALLARPEAARVLQIFEAASHRPACMFPIRWDDPVNGPRPDMQALPQAARMIAAQALLASRQGHAAEAEDWLAVGLRLFQQKTAAPGATSLILQLDMLRILARVAPAIMDQESAPGPSAAELQRLLAAPDLSAWFLTALRGSRVIFLRWAGTEPEPLMVFQVGSDSVLDRSEMLTLAACRSRLGDPLRRYDQAMLLRVCSQLIPLAVRPYRETGAAVHALDERQSALTAALDFVSYKLLGDPLFLFAPAPILAVMTADDMAARDEGQARLALWRVALALKAYRTQHPEYPADLAALQGAATEPLPLDPFSGRSLLYRREDAGFVLYSMGEDLRDDGGRPITESDQPGPPRPREGDLVWRCAR